LDDNTRGKVVRLIIFWVGVALLNSCTAHTPLIAANKLEIARENERMQAQKEAERLQQCLAQLGALRNINAKQHQQYQQAFDKLMSGASQYASLRIKVNGDIQETVDALYRYKVNYLCAAVNQVVLVGLAERGEPEK